MPRRPLLLILGVLAVLGGAWFTRKWLKRPPTAEERVAKLGAAGTQPIVDMETVETICEEASMRVLDWCEQLRAKNFTDKDGVISPSFSGSALAEAPELSHRDLTAGARSAELDAAKLPRVDRAGFLEALAKLAGGWKRLDAVVLDLTRADFVPGPPITGAIEWTLELLGDDAAGKRRSLAFAGSGELKLENRRWCLTRLDATACRSLSRDRPLFTEVTKEAGVELLAPDFDNKSYSWEGAACADLDGDGRLDLLVPSTQKSCLYVANAAGGWVDEAERRGIAAACSASGVAFFDYDNDRDLDLALADEGWTDEDGQLHGSSLRIFRRDGAGDDWRFVDVTDELGCGLRDYYTTLCVLDFDNDGWLDLFVGTYGDLARARNNAWTHADNAPRDLLLRNVGGKSFEDVSEAAGLVIPAWALGCAVADWDEDGDVDLYVANDYGPNQLWQNDGKGRFTDRALELGAFDRGYGMSASFGDLDNDGKLDLYVSNMSAVEADRIRARLSLPVEKLNHLDDCMRGNSVLLQRDGRFERMPPGFGATDGRWAWASQLCDLDLDGRLDIVCVNGFITRTTMGDIRSLTWRNMFSSSVDAAAEPSIRVPQQVNSKQYRLTQYGRMWREGWSYAGRERDKVWLNRGDGFEDLSDVSGADSPGDGRALIAADCDDDGDCDLFVHEIQRSRHHLLRNDLALPPSGAAPRGFVKVRLEATTSHWSAVNAQVTVRGANGPCTQLLAIGNAYLSQLPYELLFGTGGASEVELSVLWPGGRREAFGKVAAGSRVLLVEGRGTPQPFAPVPHPLALAASR